MGEQSSYRRSVDPKGSVQGREIARKRSGCRSTCRKSMKAASLSVLALNFTVNGNKVFAKLRLKGTFFKIHKALKFKKTKSN